VAEVDHSPIVIDSALGLVLMEMTFMDLHPEQQRTECMSQVQIFHYSRHSQQEVAVAPSHFVNDLQTAAGTVLSQHSCVQFAHPSGDKML